MKQSLETLVSSAEQNKTSSTQPPSETPAQQQQERTKKGILFSSSIGLNIDKNRLKDELNCELKVIPTYHVEHHSDAKDPDAYLQCMVNQHLSGKTDFDFAIIATGSNDITRLDTETMPPTTLFSRVEEQSKLAVEIAIKITTENDINVFLVEKPPRYDPENITQPP